MRPSAQAGTIAHDLAAAFGLLTRLPVRVDGVRAMARGAANAWAYSLVGAVVGGIVAGVATVASVLGLGGLAAATLAVVASVIVTGALHEDGLADTADGLGGGGTPQRRLEIMKDSRTGAYGVLALALSVLLRVTLLAQILAAGAIWQAAICAAMLSRASMVAVWAALPPARAGGVSRGIGRPTARTAAIALALCLPALVAVPTDAAISAFACATIAASLMALCARRLIGGQTGDILGAVEQVAALGALAALAAATSE